MRKKIFILLAIFSMTSVGYAVATPLAVSDYETCSDSEPCVWTGDVTGYKSNGLQNTLYNVRVYQKKGQFGEMYYMAKTSRGTFRLTCNSEAKAFRFTCDGYVYTIVF